MFPLSYSTLLALHYAVARGGVWLSGPPAGRRSPRLRRAYSIVSLRLRNRSVGVNNRQAGEGAAGDHIPIGQWFRHVRAGENLPALAAGPAEGEHYPAAAQPEAVHDWRSERAAGN